MKKINKNIVGCVQSSKELIELAESKGITPLENKIYGKFIIMPSTTMVVSELYIIQDAAYHQVKDVLLNTPAIDPELHSLISVNGLYGPTCADSINFNGMSADIIALVKESLVKQKEFNISKNALENEVLKRRLGSEFIDNNYFDYLDSNNLILKDWVVELSKLRTIKPSGGEFNIQPPMIIPANPETVNAIMKTVIENYIPSVYLPGGEHYETLPKSEICKDGYGRQSTFTNQYGIYPSVETNTVQSQTWGGAGWG